MKGKAKCRMHGGKSLGGIASPRFKNGRWSSKLPHRLLERFEEAFGDRQLLELTAEIALLDTFIDDLLGKLDTGESGPLWSALKKAWGQVEAFKDDPLFFAVSLDEVGRLIKRGFDDQVLRVEITSLLQQRRVLVESQRKREVEAKQTITLNEALALIKAIGESVQRNVSDPKALTAIQSDIVFFTGGGVRQLPAATQDR
jgi:hypothetical protein